MNGARAVLGGMTVQVIFNYSTALYANNSSSLICNYRLHLHYYNLNLYELISKACHNPVHACCIMYITILVNL